MTQRQPFPNNKKATDFDEAKLTQLYQPPRNVSSAGLKLCWSPGGHFIAWTPGDSTVTLTPWDATRQAVSECMHEGDLQYSQRVISTVKPVKALALGSSLTGTGADFGKAILQAVTKNGTGEDNGEKKSWFRYHNVQGLVLATGFQNGHITCFNAYTGDLIFELRDHKQAVLDLQFVADGSLRLASCSADGTAKLWDLRDDGNMYKTVQPRSYRGPLYACAWAPDARTLVVVGQMGMVSVWETAEGAVSERHLLTGHQHTVTACQFSSDGALLLTASLDSRAILWNPYLATKLCEYCHLFPPPSLIFASGANAAGVTAAGLCPDGQHLATICEDKYMRIWSLHSEGGPTQVMRCSEPGPSFCQYSPDGTTLVTGPFNQGISFFVVPPGSPSPLRQLSRSCIYRQLQKKIPGLQIPKALESLVAEGFLPRDIKDFVQYKMLSAG